MRRHARILPVLLALGAAGPAAGFTPDRAAIFVEALRGNDCAMRSDEAPEALPPLGLEADEVQQFVDILFSTGLVDLSDDSQVLTLADGLCAADADASLAMIEAAFDAGGITLDPWQPQFSPDQGAALIGAVRANGCSITDAQATVLFPDAGIDPTLSRDIVAVMIEGELAAVGDEGARLDLSEALCAADPAGDAAVIGAAHTAFLDARPDPAVAENPEPPEGGE